MFKYDTNITWEILSYIIVKIQLRPIYIERNTLLQNGNAFIKVLLFVIHEMHVSKIEDKIFETIS